MTDDREDKRTAALAVLTDAIDAFDRVNDTDGDNGLLMDWVLITASHIEDGSQYGATPMAVQTRAGQPAYRTVGFCSGPTSWTRRRNGIAMTEHSCRLPAEALPGDEWTCSFCGVSYVADERDSSGLDGFYIEWVAIT